MKIEEQVLSIEQMKHLQELGVDTSEANMYWVRAKRITGEQKNNCIDNDMGKWRLSLSKGIVLPAAWAVESVPTYTVGDIIEKLPIGINSLNRGIVILRCYVGAGYLKDNLNSVSFSDSPLLESLYNLLCWVAENHIELLEVKK